MKDEKHSEKHFLFLFSSLISFNNGINTLCSSDANAEVSILQTGIVNPWMLSLQGMLPERTDALPTTLRGGLKLTHYPASSPQI